MAAAGPNPSTSVGRPLRVLVTIPHYWNPDRVTPLFASRNVGREARAAAVRACLRSWRETFARPQYLIDLRGPGSSMANVHTAAEVTLIVCTTDEKHVLDDMGLPGRAFLHARVRCPPQRLGFICHSILRRELGSYDYYCFCEDDLILGDPWNFKKLQWFAGCAGVRAVLQPNRFEVATDGTGRKAYIDGHLDSSATAAYQDISVAADLRLPYMGHELLFTRTCNPHSGCFFLTAEQMAYWASQPYFLDGDSSFFTPLESAATLGLMKTFHVYKPGAEVANFFEIQHFGDRWIRRVDRRNAAAVKHAEIGDHGPRPGELLTNASPSTAEGS